MTSPRLDPYQIRDLLKVKATCLRAGFPLDNPFILALDEVILTHIQQRGVVTYVSEQLGPLWSIPAEECRFWFASGLEIVPPVEWRDRVTGKYVLARFGWNGLPFKIEGRGKVRYL